MTAQDGHPATKTMSGDHSAPHDERIIALLGAAACRPMEPTAEPCPSAEALAAFIDNRLAGVEREAMLAHLNCCPGCYQHWLEAATYLQSVAPDRKSPVISPPLARGRSLANFLSSWKVFVPVGAVAVLVALVVFWPPAPAPDLAGRIDSGYASVRANAPSQVAEIARSLRLPWEEETSGLGFSGLGASPSQRAFGAGLWAGRAELQGGAAHAAPPHLATPTQATWQGSDWADYYQLGRWTVLLWALIQTENGDVDWRPYQETLRALRARLAARPDEEEAARAVAALDGIEPLVSKLQAETIRLTAGGVPSELQRRIEITMRQLAP